MTVAFLSASSLRLVTAAAQVTASAGEAVSLRERYAAVQVSPRPLRPRTSRGAKGASAGDHAILHSATRGQEFVLDADQYPEATAWAQDLILSESQ
jgi:hypothetical protein